MLAKIRLEKTRPYERAVAVFYLAEMLIAFLDGRPHNLRLGCEQGGIPNWDDFIIEADDGTQLHHQVKRQNVPFDAIHLPRRTKNKNSKFPDNTPLDNALQSLATWTLAQGNQPPNPSRRFILELPSTDLEVKKKLFLRHLRELCTDCHNPTTAAAGLGTRIASDTSTEAVWQWLNTWCGVADHEHLLRTLRLLDLRTAGDEVKLRIDTELMLATRFVSPDHVREAIYSFLDNTAIDTGAITPRLLLDQLRSSLRPDRPTWTQYRRIGIEPWRIDGTNGPAPIPEPPQSVVGAFWGTSTGLQTLRIEASWCKSRLAHAVARLALHLPSPAHAVFSEPEPWRIGANNSVGGTLGLSPSQSPTQLPIGGWKQCADTFQTSDYRALEKTANADAEADLLHEAMDERVWSEVATKLTKTIEAMSAVEIRDEMEALWAQWRTALNTDPPVRTAFLHALMRPAAERMDVYASLRVGPHTVELLAHGIFLLLAVAAAIGTSNADWTTLGEDRGVRTLALASWSGAAGQPNEAQMIDENPSQILGKETAPILILSGVQGSPADIRGDSLADDTTHRDSLADPKLPAIVTSDPSLRRLLKTGTLTELRTHLTEKVKTPRQRRE